MFTAVSRKVPTKIEVYSTRAQANAAAKFFARYYGASFSVVPYTDPWYVSDFWQEFGWYCQHSFDFCEACHFGYDHPADIVAEVTAYAQGFPANVSII